jgi:hypothetical protein
LKYFLLCQKTEKCSFQIRLEEHEDGTIKNVYVKKHSRRCL